MLLKATASRWDLKGEELLHNLIMSLRLQYDPLKVRDAGQSLAWDPVHVDVVVLQVQSQQGRWVSETDFTHRLHWNSTGTHLCTELHTHKSLTNTLTYMFHYLRKIWVPNFILTLPSSLSWTVQNGYKPQGFENIVSRSYGLCIWIHTITGRQPNKTHFFLTSL